MKVNVLFSISTFFHLVGVCPWTDRTKMAASDTVVSSVVNTTTRRVYSRDRLLHLSIRACQLRCPSFEDWVPQISPLCSGLCRATIVSHGQLPSPCWSRDVNNNTRCRKRGRRGGIRVRIRKTRNTVPLPIITFANVRSFGRNKGNFNLDCLHTNVKFLSEYRDSNILCFTETWWCSDTPSENTYLEGFGYPYRTDRDNEISGKKTGGGVCVYVSERWCRKKAVIVRESVSTANVDILTLSFRPDYLPRDFGQIFVTVVYCQPKALEKDCLKSLRDIVDKMNKVSPLAPHIICGDFNQNDLKKQLPNFYQYVSCTTRKNAVLDKCYGNIKSAYRSIQRAPVGDSDHCALYMLPQYVTKFTKRTCGKENYQNME